MIPYSRQNIDQKDVKGVVKTLKSPWLTQGPAVLQFEQKLARAGGTKYAVAVSSGTAALHLAYLAAGLTKGDEVITTPNTFVATTNMLLAVGAKPVFCDIRLDTYNIDEAQIEKLITTKTRAIVSVDFAGYPAEYGKINQLARKHGLVFISDACHALGATFQGSPVGSLADMTIFSFHPVKSITTGEGGAILTDNKKYYNQAKSLRSHGISKNKQGKNVMTDLGFNYRITDLQAALGLSQLKKLAKFISLRHQVAKWYFEELKDFERIILPHNYEYSAWHLFVIRVADSKFQQPLHDYLVAKGIGANFHYPGVYSHPYYRKNGFAKLALPYEEIYQKSCLSIPCYPALTRKQVKYICRCITSFFEKNAKSY